ncbi:MULTISPECIES: hypothetical protein [unclassified Arcicella]|uniref:hypothetical protein n=1 Tax=unclassified Arcicella TaxID=2644986 RepID=UPI002863F358|nr:MULTISPECIES: hypothetical protein [unclassified Arcicella]MDR6561292.1 hypothetical protein [Arcicella sp. BE51]MDR6811176.1 hypothetical protein [Arcicella sp. BE140]MDR6822526.1 hypothetical protein [Arcicella sp. BE139]
MEINTNGLTPNELRDGVAQGGKFVFFKYTISIIIMTFRRTSDIYYIEPGGSTFTHSWSSILINLLLGWWGLPWGPIYTIGALYNNFSGGEDVTGIVMSQINDNDASYGTGTNYNIPGQGTNTSTSSQPTYNIPNNGGNNDGNTYNIPRN